MEKLLSLWERKLNKKIQKMLNQNNTEKRGKIVDGLKSKSYFQNGIKRLNLVLYLWEKNVQKREKHKTLIYTQNTIRYALTRWIMYQCKWKEKRPLKVKMISYREPKSSVLVFLGRNAEYGLTTAVGVQWKQERFVSVSWYETRHAVADSSLNKTSVIVSIYQLYWRKPLTWVTSNTEETPWVVQNTANWISIKSIHCNGCWNSVCVFYLSGSINRQLTLIKHEVTMNQN